MVGGFNIRGYCDTHEVVFQTCCYRIRAKGCEIMFHGSFFTKLSLEARLARARALAGAEAHACAHAFTYAHIHHRVCHCRRAVFTTYVLQHSAMWRLRGPRLKLHMFSSQGQRSTSNSPNLYYGHYRQKFEIWPVRITKCLAMCSVWGELVSIQWLWRLRGNTTTSTLNIQRYIVRASGRKCCQTLLF